MAFDILDLASGSLDPKVFLGKVLVAHTVGEAIEYMGSAGANSGDEEYALAEEAFLMVPQTTLASAMLGSGLTQAEVIEIGMNAAFQDANFIRQVRADLGEEGGGAVSDQLVRFAEAIIQEQVEEGTLEEDDPDDLVELAEEGVKTISESAEEAGEAIKSLPDDILKSITSMPTLRESVDAFGRSIAQSAKDIKENIDFITPMVDKTEDLVDSAIKSISTPIDLSTLLEPMFSSGRAVLAAPGDFADSITDFFGDQYDELNNQIDLIGLRGGRR